MLAFSLTLAGCWGGGDDATVTVYCALDSEFAQPILDTFERESRIAILAKTDVEANKSVGLAQALIAERARPRCDLFWNNEVLHTIRLDKLGLLAPTKPRWGASVPAAFKSSTGTWYGFAARARVVLVNTDLVAQEERPTRVADLAEEKWRGRCALANPSFGTTATHVACLWASRGERETKDFLARVRANEAQVLPGNKQVARAVSDGRVAFGVTDTDDAIIEIEAGRPVTIVYPDQGPADCGTLFIPNTIAVIRGGPHPEAAERLLDYVLSPQVEGALAVGPSAQAPLLAETSVVPRIATPHTVKAMRADFSAAADAWEAAAAYVRGEFAR